MTHFFDLKWLLLIPALPTMGVIAWSLLKITGNRSRRLVRLAGSRGRNRVEVWD